MSSLQPGDALRVSRRKIHETVGARAIETHKALESRHAIRYLTNLVKSPSDFRDHIKKQVQVYSIASA